MKAYDFILKRLKVKNYIDVKAECDDKPCCPYCGKILSEGKPMRLQSLEEHVFDPNGEPSLKKTLQCNNESCYLGKFSVWTEEGESYVSDKYVELIQNKEFSTERDKIWDLKSKYMHSAINTFGRRMEAEEEYNGMYKSQAYLSPLLMFNKRQPCIRIYRLANEKGEVLKLKFHLQFLRKDEEGNFCLLCKRFDKDIAYEIEKIRFKKKMGKFDKQKYILKFKKRRRVTVAEKLVIFFVKYFVRSDVK